MRQLSLLSGLSLLLLCGCSEPKVNLPEPVPAGGKISFADGRPVNNVRVFFHPLGAPSPASGVVKGGAFTLQTHDSKTGACVGKYRVIFQVNHEDYKSSNAALQTIPLKYREDASPLEVEIPAGGKQDLEIKLDAR